MNNHKSASSNSNNDYLWAVFIGVFVGAILGGIGGVFLPGIYYVLANPDVLNDGQFGLIYLASLPVGALVGAVAGAALLCFVTARMHAEK